MRIRDISMYVDTQYELNVKFKWSSIYINHVNYYKKAGFLQRSLQLSLAVQHRVQIPNCIITAYVYVKYVEFQLHPLPLPCRSLNAHFYTLSKIFNRFFT
jgi:hypothetical protein